MSHLPAIYIAIDFDFFFFGGEIAFPRDYALQWKAAEWNINSGRDVVNRWRCACPQIAPLRKGLHNATYATSDVIDSQGLAKKVSKLEDIKNKYIYIVS